MSATVKDRMTVLPTRLQASLATGNGEEKTIVIENYSNQDWVDLVISPRTDEGTPSCISVVSVVPADTSKRIEPSHKLPRQIWTATLHIDPGNLSDGSHQERLEMIARSETGESERTFTTFDIEVRPDARVIPRTLVFWPSQSESITGKSAVLKYAKAEFSLDASRISYTHDLPFDVDVQFSPSGAESTLIKFSIKSLPETFDTIRGGIDLSLPDPLNKTVNIPVVVLGRE